MIHDEIRIRKKNSQLQTPILTLHKYKKGGERVRNVAFAQITQDADKYFGITFQFKRKRNPIEEPKIETSEGENESPEKKNVKGLVDHPRIQRKVWILCEKKQGKQPKK